MRLGVHTHSQHPPTPTPRPVQQVPQSDLDWESGIAGNVSVWVLVLWDNVGQICDRAAVILAGRGRWGRQTKPEWAAGHFPPDALGPLMSGHRGSPTVGASPRPRLSRITLADHPYPKKCAARFKFSQECGPSERPPSPSGPLLTWGTLLCFQSVSAFSVWPGHLGASVS